MDAIILAGGKGSRMEYDVPKPLVNVKGKPIISHQIDYLENRVSRIIISLGHRHEEVINRLHDLYGDNHKIVFSVEYEPLGTAGGLKLAMQKLSSADFVALNCDDITDIDMQKLASQDDNTICVAHPRLPFGRVVSIGGYASFEEKPLLRDWVSCGWYKMNADDMRSFLPDIGMLEYQVFPKIKLKMYYHEGFWRPLNNKKDIEEFEKLNDYPTENRDWIKKNV